MYKNKTYNPTSYREIIGSPFLSSMCMLCLCSHYHHLSVYQKSTSENVLFF
nr:MAG TPA: capsid assembly scaffolding protein [Caudoviricetes sp.]